MQIPGRRLVCPVFFGRFFLDFVEKFFEKNKKRPISATFPVGIDNIGKNLLEKIDCLREQARFYKFSKNEIGLSSLNKQLTVYWKKDKTVLGYQVQIANNKKMVDD